MYYKILNKIGLKRMPPILVPIGIPFIIVALIGVLLFMLFYWLLGFWSCHKCNRTYWVIHDRKATNKTSDEFWKEHVCDACQTMDALTGEEEKSNRGPVPPSGITRPF